MAFVFQAVLLAIDSQAFTHNDLYVCFLISIDKFVFVIKSFEDQFF